MIDQNFSYDYYYLVFMVFSIFTILFCPLTVATFRML